MFWGIWALASLPEVWILKEFQNGSRASALPLQPKSFLWQENIYKNIIKYSLIFPSTPNIVSFFLKTHCSQSWQSKQKMTTEAVINWLTLLSWLRGRDDKSKKRKRGSLLLAPDLQNVDGSQRGSHQPLNLVVFENRFVLLSLTSLDGDLNCKPGCREVVFINRTGPMFLSPSSERKQLRHAAGLRKGFPSSPMSPISSERTLRWLRNTQDGKGPAVGSTNLRGPMSKTRWVSSHLCRSHWWHCRPLLWPPVTN